jgi:hypothetical protein
MLYREIIAVCSQIHTKHINTLCGQNVELLNVKLVVHIVTGARCGVVVKALRYKPAGRGFDSRWFHWNFSVT